jgi:hypothetical protein
MRSGELRPEPITTAFFVFFYYYDIILVSLNYIDRDIF